MGFHMTMIYHISDTLVLEMYQTFSHTFLATLHEIIHSNGERIEGKERRATVKSPPDRKRNRSERSNSVLVKTPLS